MRRWLVLPLLALLALATACGDKDDVEGSDEEPVLTGVDQAVEIAQLSLPAPLGDDVVADLIEDLCSAAGSGDVDGVVAQLQGSGVEAAEAGPALDALAAGAGTYCPDDVDDVLPQVQQALAPTTTAAVAAAGGAASGPSTRSSASSGSSGGGSNAGGASTSSSGSASVGGGNASGTGNSSSTDFTQGVSSSNSSSSGGGSSNSTTTG